MVWPGPELARQPDRAGDVDAGRAAEAQALLLDQVEDDRQRLLVGDLPGEVGREAFEIGGDAALPDAFGDRAAFGLEHAVGVEAVERRAQRIGERDLHVRVLRLAAPIADAGQRAAGADRRDEAVDLAVRSAPRSPAPVVRIWPSRLATLSNWLAQIAPFGSLFASCSASRPDTFT